MRVDYELLLGSKTKLIRPNRIITYDDPPWKLIVFLNGKRIIKFPLEWSKAKELRDKFIEKGVPVAIAHRLRGNFQPKGVGQPGQLWCGYCREWRFFKVLKSDPVYGVLGRSICPYCMIPEDNLYITMWNGPSTRTKRSRAALRRIRRRRKT